MAKQKKSTTDKKGTKFKTIDLKVDPCQGISRMATSIEVPGYVFFKMDRRGTKAKITFIREDLAA